MKNIFRILAFSAFVTVLAVLAVSPIAGQMPAGNDKLAVFGDIVLFAGGGKPNNCYAMNRFKKGDPVGFRVTALNPATGMRDRATQLVVHLTYGGKTVDLPMRDRETPQQADHNFWVLKWMVPDDAPTGIVKWTVTAKDPQGRIGSFTPFQIAASELTIVE